MTSLVVVGGDITVIETDAIVNAANSSLMGGGGVDGAIHLRGGPAVMAECQAIRARQGGCDPGDAVATTAGDLPARWVIHTVGPIWTAADAARHEATLARAYTRSLDVAEEFGASRVSFPNVSTGVYEFPKRRAADVAISAVRERTADSAIEQVLFVCLDEENLELYRERLKPTQFSSEVS
jgi:O-acetyl-ADP-ribose deacetylase